MIYTCSSLVSIPSHRLVFHHGPLSCEWHQCLQSEVSMIDVPHVIKSSRCKGPGEKDMSLYHGCNNNGPIRFYASKLIHFFVCVFHTAGWQGQ